jgi:hypothetical protein
MHTLFFSLVALWLVCSCRGCDESDSGSLGATAPKKEQQSDQAQLRARLAARALDRKKSYPKRDDGLVACGADADCFLIQSEHCTPAVVSHSDQMSGYGLHERIEARYTIVGNDQGKCRVLRDTLALDAKLDKSWIDLLKKQSKTAEDIEQLQANALETLREGNPERFECRLTADQMLEAALGLAESLYDQQFWRLVCNEVERPLENP